MGWYSGSGFQQAVPVRALTGSEGGRMNARSSTSPLHSLQTFPGPGSWEPARDFRRTYRFADGVRVMVCTYDTVVWIYPDGRRIQSRRLGADG